MTRRHASTTKSQEGRVIGVATRQHLFTSECFKSSIRRTLSGWTHGNLKVGLQGSSVLSTNLPAEVSSRWGPNRPRPCSFRVSSQIKSAWALGVWRARFLNRDEAPLKREPGSSRSGRASNVGGGNARLAQVPRYRKPVGKLRSPRRVANFQNGN